VVRDKVAFFTPFASTLFAFHIERAMTDCHAFVWRDAGWWVSFFFFIQLVLFLYKVFMA
jgi:hypothetical protein